MKSIMLSIQPQYCENILSGEKTLELRKTTPKEVPFKVYMYQTKRHWIYKILQWLGLWQGKVVAEFIVNKIDEYSIPYPAFWNEFKDFDLLCKQSCLSKLEIHNYAGTNTIYALHISDLKIYDKPKNLSEFYQITCKYYDPFYMCAHCLDKDCKYIQVQYTDNGKEMCCNHKEQIKLTRAPQSWQYVELKGE